MNRRSVMIIDDEPDVRDLLAQVLELEGFRAVTAADGSEALRLLRTGTDPDAILLDLRMPGMNGWEFRAAQLADPPLAGIPVFIVTADHTQDDGTVARLRPAGFFRKPPDMDALVAELARQPARSALHVNPVEPT